MKVDVTINLPMPDSRDFEQNLVRVVKKELEGHASAINANADAAGTGSGDMLAANNLSDLVSASAALSNLDGVSTAALSSALTAYLSKAGNLSGLASASTARSNLGLDTASTKSVADFCQTANNLSDVTAATALTNLGFSAFGKTIIDDADGDAVMTTLGMTSYGQAIAKAASYAAIRTLLSLGTIATQNYTAVNIDGGTFDGVDYLKSGGYGVGHGYVQVTSSSGTRQGILKAQDTPSYVHVGSTSNHSLQLIQDNTSRCVLTSVNFRPEVDDAMDLGYSTRRWTDIYATNGTIQTSDGELKESVEETPLGLDFIMALSPKQFKWKDYEIPAQVDVDGAEKEPAKIKTHKRKHHGLITQDVAAVLEASKIDTNDFAGLIIDEETGRHGLRYHEFIAPMIKAIQELRVEVEALKKEKKK